MAIRSNTHGDDFSDLLRDVEEFRDTSKIRAGLDRELSRLTEALRFTMPVRTGLLRSSGVHFSESDENSWEGIIEFGVGVEYAVYVLNRKPNDYDALVESWSPRFGDVLDGNDPGLPEF